jgi:hypothetical protein
MLQQQLTSSLHAGEAPDGDALCAIEVLPRKTLKKKKGSAGGGGARVTDGSHAQKSPLNNNLPGSFPQSGGILDDGWGFVAGADSPAEADAPAEVREHAHEDSSAPARHQEQAAGTQFTCFTSTEVQILTPEGCSSSRPSSVLLAIKTEPRSRESSRLV